mmetsp:Transcript_15398/g.22442  ORF Transcript_15398/g.22442 Transcript_15398/m.22442 type:complete len:1032 (-) Transcript_15398:71-3166(-)
MTSAMSSLPNGYNGNGSNGHVNGSNGFSSSHTNTPSSSHNGHNKHLDVMNNNSNNNNKNANPNGTNGSSSHHQHHHKSNNNYSSKKKTSAPVSYELFAPRSSEQRSRLAKLQALTAGPIANHANRKHMHGSVSSSSSSLTNNKRAGVDGRTEGLGFDFVSAILPSNDDTGDSNNNNNNNNNSASNSNTMTTSENHAIGQALEHARSSSSNISKILSQTCTLHTALHQTTTLASYLTKRHTTLLQHSSELSHNAERLQSESDALSRHAEEIGLPLQHYDAVDRLGVMVGVLFKNKNVVKETGLAKIKVDDTSEFKVVLDDIDAAVRFFMERSEISAANANAAAAAAAAASTEGNANTDDIHSEADAAAANTAESGSMEYYRRALALQDAAMDLFKEAIVARLIQTTMQITSALDLTRKSVGGDTLEASLIYTRFHGISSRSQHLLNMVLERMGTVMVNQDLLTYSSSSRRSRARSALMNTVNNTMCPYTELWDMCRNTYIQSRQSLLKLSVRNHLDFLKEKHGLIGMTRLASVFLMRLCTAETAMYLDFFGKEEEEETKENDDKAEENGSAKANGGDDANTGAHTGKENGSGSGNGTTTAKKGPKAKDAATLASQVMAKDGTYYDSEFQSFLDMLCENLHRTIRRGIVSILELDTLCQIVSVLREERSLANASPTTMVAARSLGRVIFDAQERLIFCANTALNKEVVRFRATPIDLDYPDKLRKYRELQDEKKENGNHSVGSSEDALQDQMQIYDSWFPPIRSVLKVLSKIFRVVEPKVFEDIALSSVQACARSLKSGGSYIEKKSGQLHSDLFLVKHLLILREQLSPFDIQLRSVERQLDFSDAGKAVSRFLANRNRRLFSMTTENALVTLLREGVSTREASIDSKRDLEDALRSACNDFIEHTSASLAGPVITLVEQCKSVTAANTSTLSSQSFMTGEYVKVVVTRTLDRLEPELGEVITQMGLYMDNKATQSILLKPVVRKIVRILEDSKRFVNECSVEGNDNWNAEIKHDVFKIIGDIENMIKSASPR